jgi:MFS transporter, putative metabolite:H+ symporter
MTEKLASHSVRSRDAEGESLGTGAASAWARAGSMIGPPLVGWLLATTHEVGPIFLVFAMAGFIGALAVLLFGTETSGRVLEEISP